MQHLTTNTKSCVPQLDQDGDNRWMSLHSRFLCQSKEREPEVVFIGDSLVQQLQFTSSWHQFIEPMHTLNFGIYGDCTQNINWRVANGELQNINAKAIVLWVGSQHPASDSAEAIVDGIETVIDCILSSTRKTALIVMGLLPCGRSDNPKRQRHKAVNELLQIRLKGRSCSDGASVQLLFPDWEQFIQAPDFFISHHDMYDYLHLTNEGLIKILDSLLDELQSCIKTFMKCNVEEGPGDDSTISDTPC